MAGKGGTILEPACGIRARHIRTLVCVDSATVTRLRMLATPVQVRDVHRFYSTRSARPGIVSTLKKFREGDPRVPQRRVWIERVWCMIRRQFFRDSEGSVNRID